MVASATAARFADAPTTTLDALPLGIPPDSPSREQTVRTVLDCTDANTTTYLGPDNVHPDDLTACVDVDRFDFPVLAQPGDQGLALHAVRP